MIEQESFQYTNRGGHKITFTYTGNEQDVVMTNYGTSLRIIRDRTDKRIEMVEPSDGPLIFLYMDFNDIIYNGHLKLFLDDPFRRKVTMITQDLMGLTITFKKEEKVDKTKKK